MLGTIIKIFFLFPFIYFIGIIIKAVYMTGGLFPTLLALLAIGIVVGCLWLSSKGMQTPEGKDYMNQRNQKEKKQADEWGIIDYFDKDE